LVRAILAACLFQNFRANEQALFPFGHLIDTAVPVDQGTWIMLPAMLRPLPRLGDVATGRNNNFNALRMLAALAVLVSHAWLITLGPDAGEPLQEATGHTLGTLAVFVFFAISGFFITASFDRSPSARRFVAARVRRIIPGLVACTALLALVLGPLVTSLPLAAYFSAPGTWAFLVRNSVPISHIFTLPGVFETNPMPIVAGSIWTLPNEAFCYLLVLLAGLTGLIRRRSLLSALLLCYAAGWLFIAGADIVLPPRIEALRLLTLPFLIGMALYLWRDRVPLSPLILVFLVLLAVLGRTSPAYDALLVAALAYGSIWFGYARLVPLRAYNRFGDYSYGTYLYAYPIQGLMVWLYGPITPWMNILAALPVTVGLAVLSWHLVEKPALD
jgi:peptidoglycan/LPS O-acetylase OafA/YrhL